MPTKHVQLYPGTEDLPTIEDGNDYYIFMSEYRCGLGLKWYKRYKEVFSVIWSETMRDPYINLRGAIEND